MRSQILTLIWNAIVHENWYSPQQSFRSSQYSAHYTFYLRLILIVQKALKGQAQFRRLSETFTNPVNLSN